jgi:hypothetical protein
VKKKFLKTCIACATITSIHSGGAHAGVMDKLCPTEYPTARMIYTHDKDCTEYGDKNVEKGKWQCTSLKENEKGTHPALTVLCTNP